MFNAPRHLVQSIVLAMLNVLFPVVWALSGRLHSLSVLFLGASDSTARVHIYAHPITLVRSGLLVETCAGSGVQDRPASNFALPA